MQTQEELVRIVLRKTLFVDVDYLPHVIGDELPDAVGLCRVSHSLVSISNLRLVLLLSVMKGYISHKFYYHRLTQTLSCSLIDF